MFRNMDLSVLRRSLPLLLKCERSGVCQRNGFHMLSKRELPSSGQCLTALLQRTSARDIPAINIKPPELFSSKQRTLHIAAASFGGLQTQLLKRPASLQNGFSPMWMSQQQQEQGFSPVWVTSKRWRSTTPMNTVIMFVPQQEAWVVERMGRFCRIMEPGLNFLIPVIDRVKYVQSLKEIAIDVPQQAAITADNVTLALDGVLYLRVVDAYKASYGVEDPEFAITQLAQTTMRSEIGKIKLDNVFRERESLNIQIVMAINNASEAWGIQCLRYEIRDMKLPTRIQEAMQMQVEAERKKRAAIMESEGIREAEINVAEGKKTSRILASEADKQERINIAVGEASALVAKAEARGKGFEIIAKSLKKEHGGSAASLSVAEQYVTALSQLARKTNTLILPNNTGDVASVVGQAMTIYRHMGKSFSDHQDGGQQKDWEEYVSDDDERAQIAASSAATGTTQPSGKSNGNKDNK